MSQPAEKIYQERQQKFEQELTVAHKWLRLLSFLRLIVFMGGLILLYQLRMASPWLIVGLAIVFISSFLFLMKRYATLSEARQMQENYIEVNRNELKALGFDFSPFGPGNEYKQSGHPYSFDLDLFGEFSLFRMLNRTTTSIGSRRLAKWLEDMMLSPEKIKARQDAVKELTEKLPWRQTFSASAMLYHEDDAHIETIKNWKDIDVKFPGETFFRIAGIVVPILTLIAIGLLIAGEITFGQYMITFFVQWSLFGVRRKETSFFFDNFGKNSALLNKYRKLFDLVENETFAAGETQAIRQLLISPRKASSEINSLNKTVKLFEARLNMITLFLFNSIFMWDINCSLALLKWHRRNASLLPQWFEAAEQFDALNSLANFAYNRPAAVFPVPENDGRALNATSVGHPLIPETERVNNDFQIGGNGEFVIITGANMAGKSTFLRTVGVNMALAMAGAPVCAKAFRFTPMPLYSHMRTDDDLGRHESYFFAELKKLKVILEALKEKGRIFIILDEILRGTNSEDKLSGSIQYLEQLIVNGGMGIIATHDLKLTELHEKHPKTLRNQCFEVDLSDEGLTFDYKLYEGVTRTMNATFLMRQMGIIPGNGQS
ncbi:hypothetical protein [Prolixibacter sp. SD074]|uniref:MutS-related protein n=1 Tax=Prolixibacter sp. SD074 TaxID=2652391 RepID=UPI001288D768|nr:hypothetical protein [Prolixibacter sp. SD074]GET29962.1 DNA mismatch repair protein MutS [Prolixibacter sp. SD074]